MGGNKIICKICLSEKNSFLFQKDNFDIYKCDNCKIVFTNIPFEFDLVSIYDSTYFQGGQEYGYGNYTGSEKVLRKEFNKSVKLLRELTNNQRNLKLLELGSAYGYFLDEAERYFNCTGLEVSKDASEFSICRGHKVLTDFYHEINAQKIGKIDIVAMFDVIEHLPDPINTVRLIDRYLNKNGLIIITTGDIDSMFSKIMGKRWRLMTPPQHTFFFSTKTLSKIFLDFNYKIEIIDRPWKLVPLGLAFYQFGSRLGLKIKPNKKISNISIPINLYDSIRLVARKL